MDLEQSSSDTALCEECGKHLSVREHEHALDTGGPSLCTKHAMEVVPLDDDGDHEG